MSKLYLIAIITVILLFRCCCVAHTQTWMELSTRADSLFKALNYDSALVTAKTALSEAQKVLGSEDTVVASILYQLGRYYLDSRNYNEAERCFKQSLKIREKQLGAKHEEVAATLYNLGAVHLRRAEYDKAESFFQRALAIREELFGAEHPRVAKSLLGYTSLKNRQDKCTEAVSFGQRAVSILEKTHGLDEPQLVTPLIVLSDVLHRLGRYSDAARHYERALDISRSSFDANHPQLARSMTGLAGVYYSMGDYVKAEPLYLQAIEAHKKQFGEDHQLVAIDLTNLGLLYMAQGKLDAAAELYRRAITIFEIALGPDHIFVGSCLDFLSRIHLEQREYEAAELVLIRALEIAKKRYGPDHSEVGVVMNSLADLFLARRYYKRADSLFRDALRIIENTLGTHHNLAIGSLNGLARCGSLQGRYEEAQAFIERATRIGEEVFGLDHPTVAKTTELLSWHYRIRKDPARSLEFAERAVGIRRYNLGVGAMVMSERDALTYAQQMHSSVNLYLSGFLDANVRGDSNLYQAADIIFSTKGEISDEIIKRRRSLVSEADSTTVALAESYRLSKHHLSQLFIQGPGDKTPKTFSRELDSLRELTNRLEAELARRSASFRREQDYRNVRTERISKLLPENSILVEYVSYDYHMPVHDSVVSRYLVVVVDDQSIRDIIDLGAGADIDRLVHQYRRHLLDIALSGRLPSIVHQMEYEKISKALYNKVWEPFEDLLAGKEMVLISPDGGLNIVSFAGLCDQEGKYLIEKYAVHYLTSGRDLIRLKDESPASSGLLALGDPDYSAPATARLSLPEEESLAPVREADSSTTFKGRAGRGQLDDITIAPLPATRHEVEKIAESWRKSSEEPMRICYGAYASEEILKAEASGKRIIHLATHGYFLQDVSPIPLPQPGIISDQEFFGENPLLLSGLFLAGANLHGKGADSAGAEDGILTAEEVTAMNLEGTALVVLSACETGLGKVTEGEGVYGLRRAFQIAGARTVVSALWSISDEATAGMMSQLYEKRDEPFPEAIRRIQLKTINKLRAQSNVDHPFSWGAFVAVGDWR
jgi:CHAT domain-containing protein/tetratricopeptide (TPR) repeat protein